MHSLFLYINIHQFAKTRFAGHNFSSLPLLCLHSPISVDVKGTWVDLWTKQGNGDISAAVLKLLLQTLSKLVNLEKLIFNYRSVIGPEAVIFNATLTPSPQHASPSAFHPRRSFTMNEFTFNQVHSIRRRPCVLWSYKHWLWLPEVGTLLSDYLSQYLTRICGQSRRNHFLTSKIVTVSMFS